jgi:erythromycin esterase
MKICQLFFLITSLTVFGCSRSDASSDRLNLDFEKVDKIGKPVKWFTGGKGYSARTDSVIYYSGHHSLRLEFKEDKGNHSAGVGTSTFPVNYALGKKIRFTGYIKTENVTDGWAGLWWRVDGPNGKTLAFDNMQSHGVSGTNDWKQYVIELPVDSTAVNINFGVILAAKGTAWFDKLMVEIDGKPYYEITSHIAQPKPDQIEWLKKNVIPLTTVDAGNGFADLQPLKTMIGNAHLVGIGEATHGTSEFFRMKHRMLEFLVKEMGFTLFAIEANMPESYKINEYVLTGKGDPKALLRGIYFWTWNTQEVLDMIEWMKTYNETASRKIQFLGFDMQIQDLAEHIVKDFIYKAEPNFHEELTEKYNAVDRAFGLIRGTLILSHPESEKEAGTERGLTAADSVLAHLESKRDLYRKKNNADTIDWAIQNARIVSQAMREVSGMRRGSTIRDEAMAENIGWIMKHAPKDSKIMLWAHNGHIGKANDRMGGYLQKAFGSDYYNFGFAFNEGKYIAHGDNGLTAYDAVPSEPGSFEYFFHSAGIEKGMLDLHKASKQDQGSSWLLEPLELRDIGAMATDGFHPASPTKEFDALIYIDKTTPSNQLRRY